ncbi:hypothetical protein DMH27_19145 [Raoultella planticola]|nr:hypothetical protein [Raoultella planticola]
MGVIYTKKFELRQGGKGVNPWSVQAVRNRVSERSQRRGGLKDEVYNNSVRPAGYKLQRS